MIDLLEESQKFLKFNKNMLQKAMSRKMMEGHVMSENQHIAMAEKVLNELIDHCEPILEEQIDNLLKLTEYSQFN